MVCSRLLLIMAIIKTCYGEDTFARHKQVSRSIVFNCIFNQKNILEPVKPVCRGRYENSFHCWPEAYINTIQTIPCSSMMYFPGTIKRKCFSNRSWEQIEYGKYCRKLPADIQKTRLDTFYVAHNLSTEKSKRFEKEFVRRGKLNVNIRLYVTCCDLIVTGIGCIILFAMISLKEKRMTLHRHLLLSFVLKDINSLVLVFVFHNLRWKRECSLSSILDRYLMLVQICWMFNEGYFQYKRFSAVFLPVQKIGVYVAFGWGFPAVMTFGVYFPLMWFDPPYEPRFLTCWANDVTYKYNYVVYSQAFFLIVLNMSMMIYLMRLIWSKVKKDAGRNFLKSSVKSARAFVISLFLLGGGYIFTIWGPRDCNEFNMFKSVVTSSQGIVITVIHVFLSREVKHAVKRKWLYFGTRTRVI